MIAGQFAIRTVFRRILRGVDTVLSLCGTVRRAVNFVESPCWMDSVHKVIFA